MEGRGDGEEIKVNSEVLTLVTKEGVDLPRGEAAWDGGQGRQPRVRYLCLK